ncbi:bifunctional phosphopantothenoylcysteine decarboxylase/phosphopantothenate--cysteine ligase CoaBC [soil metagenome]
MSLDELSGRHVLLGVSGGIAAYKAASLARGLVKAGATVQAVLTEHAAAFVGPPTFAGLTGRPAHTGVLTDAHRVLHVRLARETDVAVFAPATANLLAKLAHGLCDDLVTSVFMCLRCPVVLAPAMHTEMWAHPATRANLAVLRDRGAVVVDPGEGELAAGDSGVGRLADEPDLLAAVAGALRTASGPLAGRRVLVTAGGTREPIDPIRFIGNRSSGKMGYALAAEAARRGARVDLVSGPTHLADPPGLRSVRRVETARQMRDAVMELSDDADVVVKAAAVADFRPAAYSAQKVKKDDEGFTGVPLERNPDILAELGRRKGRRLLVGFAAETDLEEERGREKLHRKGLDLIVVNRVDAPDAGFSVDTNRAVLLSAGGGRTEVPLTSKAELARVVYEEVESLLDEREPAGPTDTPTS